MTTKQRFLIPEVVQTSAMDCGPASLAAILAGLDIDVDYHRLRDACQTDVDGTSIDTIEDIAVALGLRAEQVVVPADWVFSLARTQLPCIAVVEIAGGLTHFVVVWRTFGRWVQLMDPASGRTWVSKKRFLAMLYRHQMKVEAADWRDYAHGQEFRAELATRLADLNQSQESIATLLDRAAADPSYIGYANLDAAIRCVRQLRETGSISRRAVDRTLHKALEAAAIPDAFAQVVAASSDLATGGPARSHESSVSPSQATGALGQPTVDSENLILRGVVLMRVDVTANRPNNPEHDATADLDEPNLASTLPSGEDTDDFQDPTADTAIDAIGIAALRGSAKPGWRARYERFLRPLGCGDDVAPLAITAILAGLLTFLEALVFRYLLDIATPANLAAFALVSSIVLLPLVAAIVVEWNGSRVARRAGRRLDVGLRANLLAKIPKIADAYFASRLISDLAERGHALTLLRTLPTNIRNLAVVLVRSVCMAGGLVWLVPERGVLIAVLAVIAIGGPLLMFAVLTERDLRIRTHLGALSRFYLDALRGAEAIWAHHAEQPMRIQYEGLLVRWWRAVTDFMRLGVALDVLLSLVSFALAIALITATLNATHSPGTLLLVAYWTLGLALGGREILRLVRLLPIQRNVAGRVVEVLESPEEIQIPLESNAYPPQTELPDTVSDNEITADMQPQPKIPGYATTGSPHLTHRSPTAQAKSPSERPAAGSPKAQPDAEQPSDGTRLDFTAVNVVLANRAVLRDVNLSIQSGEQIAIVGASGSGKSTLIGSLLGWHPITSGTLLVDGVEAAPAVIAGLRERTTWIDPATYLWNRTVSENLHYGGPPRHALASVLQRSEVLPDLEKMPDGLSTTIGENGSRLSGGEGQRLRIARGLLGGREPLVLLDEALRGMDSQQRQRLLHVLRQDFYGSTLLCVCHDIESTLNFDRILVIEDGAVVEDDAPAKLADDPDSMFAHLLRAERALQKQIDGNPLMPHYRLASAALERV